MINETEKVERFLRNEKERERYIRECAKKLYNKFNYLFSESLNEDEYVNEAVNKYVYTSPYYNYDEVQIVKEMSAEIEKRSEEYKTKNNNLIEEPKEDISNNNIDTIVPEQMVSVQNEPITPVVINSYERVTPVQVISDSNVLPPTNNDLNTMMEESQNNQSINEDVNSKQYVKTNNNDSNKQGGFVSISNVILVVLCITTFVLMAMILNLLLK